MGADCCGRDNPGKCSCFDSVRRHLQSVSIVRYSQTKWIWLESHDEALMCAFSCFCTDYDAPYELARLIKEHAYDDRYPYYITHATVSQERYCSAIQQKLTKKILCPHWYSAQIRAFESISVGLHISSNRDDDIFASLSDRSLPALQMNARHYMARYEQVRRTIHVDGCRLNLHLIALRKTDQKYEKLIAFPKVHVIVLEEGDSVNWINLSCQKIWNRTRCMKNVFIFNRMQKKNEPNASQNTIREVCRYWNIPCISGNEKESQAVDDLFNFMVKYYWFCDVVG
mmetsp:Transcript_28512/g.45087  ORF Transcript_28512/g.45087 Transcript_28512/m.45087 type:complete len:284 (-) Transcript_28512:173-1024(-)